MSDPYYRTQQWKRLRTEALKRDGYQCAVPGCQEPAIVGDHVKSRKYWLALGINPDTLDKVRSLCRTHDNQVKERPNGERANGGRFKLLGCGVDGWPRSRTGENIAGPALKR